VFSVPGRWPRSCPPPKSNGLNGQPSGWPSFRT
jgi:hypothetical protein